MGPKKKGKGKKSKAPSGKKKEPENVLTFNEAVLMHQLELKLSQVNDVKDDIEDLKYRNERQKQRNQFLTQEQERQVKTVLDQVHNIESVEDKKEKVPYEDVEKALNLKLNSISVEEKLIEELNRNISKLDEDIQSHSKWLEEVKNYKEYGQHVDRTHIDVLTKEMDDMDRSYAEMTDFFEKSLVAVKNRISKKNEDGINDQKKLVSELAIQNLNGNMEIEFLDNKWLHKEVDLHRKHIESVEKEVESMEQHNIRVMSQLFDKQMDEVIQTKQFYLACQEAEHDKNDIGTPRALVSYNNDYDIYADGDDAEEVIAEHNDTRMNNDGDDGGDVDDNENAVQLFDDYLTEFDDMPHEDDFKLGPMEIRLLCVYGTKMEVLNQQNIYTTVDGSPSSINNNNSNKMYTRFEAERDELINVSK